MKQNNELKQPENLADIAQLFACVWRVGAKNQILVLTAPVFTHCAKRVFLMK